MFPLLSALAAYSDPYSKKQIRNAESQYYIGRVIMMVMELKKIIIKLFRWFKASAEQGNARDQNNPVDCYYMVKE
jgi:hypothetical protein